MRARKCDRCGKFYEHYSGEGTNYEKANAVLCIDRDMENNYYPKKTYDFCPKCMNKFFGFINKANTIEVVCCKDCEYGDKYVVDNDTFVYKCRRMGMSGFTPDHFCSYGMAHNLIDFLKMRGGEDGKQ